MIKVMITGIILLYLFINSSFAKNGRKIIEVNKIGIQVPIGAKTEIGIIVRNKKK